MFDYGSVGGFFNDGITEDFMPNRVYEKRGYYISYNWYDRRIYGSDTTALVCGSKFYVLNGDHREAYKRLESWEACFDYYSSNKALWNKYTEEE